MTLEDPLRAGVYRHYKGHLYLLLGVADDSDHVGRRVAVYVGLQLDGARPGTRMHVRTRHHFTSLVCPERGCVAYGLGTCLDHERVRRFEYVGEDWPGDGSWPARSSGPTPWWTTGGPRY